MSHREGRRVVQVITSLAPGGAETRMLELIGYLKTEGIEFLVFQSSGARGPLTDAYEAAGARVITVKFRRLSFWWNIWRAFRDAETQAYQCGLAPGGQLTPPLLALAFIAGVPNRVARFHSEGPREPFPFTTRCVDGVGKLFVELFANKINAVSPGALSHAFKDSWEADARCRVLVAGLDLSRFEIIFRSADVRHDLNIAAGDLIVLHIGRGVVVKNRELAIRALGAARDARLHLVFVGVDQEPDRQRWLQSATEQDVGDRVHFLGYRKDVAELMAQSDALLLTSTYEGLPGVVFEAHAAGLRVVASDIPGVRYIAERLGGVHLVHLKEPVSVWARALDDVASRPRVSMEGRQRILQGMRGTEFDLERAALGYLDAWGIAPKRDPLP